MHLVIISGASRAKQRSNTAKIIESFQKGFTEKGDTAEEWYLADRAQWDGAREAFEANTVILFALPLYVENIPGIMLEFLETLPPKQTPGTKIAFLLQGGFPEAAQSRCCVRFLEMLPAQLGCEYAGTLTKGDMFGLRMMGEKLGTKLSQPFEEMGRVFAQKQCFDKETVISFAGPEHLPKGQIIMFRLVGKHIQRKFMNKIARSMGCKGKLDDRPIDITGV